MPPTSPVPPEVSTELERVARRWRELPLDHALARAPVLRALAENLAADDLAADDLAADDLAADDPATGGRARPSGARVPDLGPAVLLDQLTVLVFDACAAGRVDGLGARLAGLRRALG